MQSYRFVIALVAIAGFVAVHDAKAFTQDDTTMGTPAKAAQFSDPDDKMPTIIFEPGQPLSYQQDTPAAPSPNRFDPTNAQFSSPNLQPDNITAPNH